MLWPNPLERTRILPPLAFLTKYSNPVVAKAPPLSQEHLDEYQGYLKAMEVLHASIASQELLIDACKAKITEAEDQPVYSWTKKTSAPLIKRLQGDLAALTVKQEGLLAERDALEKRGELLVRLVEVYKELEG